MNGDIQSSLAPYWRLWTLVVVVATIRGLFFDLPQGPNVNVLE